MTIRAVFFDMGGTLQTFGYTPELRLAVIPGLREFLVLSGIDLPLDDQALYQLVSNGLARYHEWSVKTMTELSPQRVWKEYILNEHLIDSALTAEVAEELMLYIDTHFYHREMRPEMPAVLEVLQQMGLKIGLISNVCSRGQVPLNLDEYGLRHYFNPIVLSSEYGRRKPDPAIFHYAARLANVPTSECLYVGDRIARDIVGARKAGFRYAIQIRHDFEHGEPDEGAAPDAVIDSMTELVSFIEANRVEETSKRPPLPANPQRVCALLFDAGDILYYRPEKGKKFKAFLTQLGLGSDHLNRKELEIAMQQAYQGRIRQEEYRDVILKAYGIMQLDQLELGRKILAEEDDSVEFFDGVQSTLVTLKKKGFLLGIVTDTANPIHVKLGWFDHGGFVDVWDSIISSQEIGVRKPDPAIYQAAMRQLGVTSDHAAFVGHKATELDGARAVGLKTIAFNYEKSAKADFYIQHFSDLLKLPVIA